MRRNMRKTLIIATILLSTPASACKLHKVWHYPYPQKCYTALAPHNYYHPSSRIVKVDVPQTSREIPSLPGPSEKDLRQEAMERLKYEMLIYQSKPVKK